MSDTDHTPSPTPIVPPLARLYRPLEGLAWPMVRVTAGAFLIPHGWGKVFERGLAANAEGFAAMGYEPGWLWGTAVALTELIGGLLLAVGFLTRPAALAVAVFMAVAVLQHWPNGFLWNNRGWEYPFFWGIVALAFVIRGGGRLSVDRAIGREF